MKTGNLKRLLRYTLRYKWSFFISVLGFIGFASADIAAVEWIRRIIALINSEEQQFGTILALSLIFIALGRGIGFFIGNYFMSRVGFGIVRDLRSELFKKLHDLPKSYFDANQSGQLINRITFTTTQVSGAASNAVKTLIREGFLLIGLFIYLLYLNFKLTLLLIGTAPLIALIVYVAGKRLKKLATKIYHYFGWLGVKMVGVNLTISGIENVNTEKSYIVVGNHPSTLDIFTHIHALPVSIRFLTKTELFRWPFFGRVLKILGLPRIDRKNAQLNLPKINKSISNVIAEGNSIMIFPEGTRSNQKDLLPFKKGAANISQSFNLPILPVVTHNAHNLMIKGKVWFKKGDIHLDILEPIENPNDYTTEELTDFIYKKIDEVLNR